MTTKIARTTAQAPPHAAARIAAPAGQLAPAPARLDRRAQMMAAADVSAPPGGAALNIALMRRLQRQVGNRAAIRLTRKSATTRATDDRVAVDRLSLDDVVPDAILQPIRQLADRVSGFGGDLTSHSDAAVDTAQAETGAAQQTFTASSTDAATTAQTEATATAAQGQAQAETAEAQGHAQAAQGEREAGQLHNALPMAEHASDPVKPAVSPPPSGSLPGVAPVPAAPGAAAWNCDEGAIVERVTSLGRSVVQRLTTAVRALVPSEVLAFAAQGIAKAQAVLGSIRQKVDAARAAVTQWIEQRLKPVRELVQKVEHLVSEKIDSATRWISEKFKLVTEKAAAAWTAVKTRVSAAVNGAITWARNGVNGLIDRGKSLAGRFWNLIPATWRDKLGKALEGLAAPIAGAYRAVTRAEELIEQAAASLRKRAAELADRAVKTVSGLYQKLRAKALQAGQALGRLADNVRKKAADAARFVYDGIDRLSGGRVSKWRAAAARRLAELKGDVCAATGAAAGPCVERFVPEPVGKDGKSFASLETKADITVPIEGVPVKIRAGAKITIERTAAIYKAILSGEGFVGVGLDLGGGKGGSAGAGAPGGGASGTVTVDGTLPSRALALLALNGQGAVLPPVPVPVGAPKPPAPPAAASPAAGGKPEVAAGQKLNVALTYTFDTTAAKTTCDGLGGLTALLATQGAAALLPAPFSALAAAGGQAAFADKLTSVKITSSETASASVKGAGGSAGASATGEAGVSLEASKSDKGEHLLTATLFQSLRGELSAKFAPGGINLQSASVGLGARQEIAITYNLAHDQLDASLKQSLSGSVTLGAFAGLLGSLPAPVRTAIQRRLACLLNASQGQVSFELSNNVRNLNALATALDAELNKGSAATAAGVWDVVSTFLTNKENCFVQFSASLNLTEKVLGVNASASSGEVSGSVDLNLSRGQQIVLCPPVKVFEGGGAAASVGADCPAPAAQVPATVDPLRPATDGPQPTRDRPPPGGQVAPNVTIPIEEARRQVQESSQLIRDLIRQRGTATDADKAKIDHDIAEIQQQRQQALVRVVLADNPNAEVVDAQRGIYRVKMVDGEGHERYLYGSISVVWNLTQVSPSVFSLGANLQAQPPQADQLLPGTTIQTTLGVGGSGIQGAAQPFPGDIDFAETFDILAPDARSAATAAYQTIVDFIQRNAARKDIEFLRLIITGGPRQGYTLPMIFDAANREPFILQLSGLTYAKGNVNTFWRAQVDGGRFIEVTKILDIHARQTGSGDRLFETREAGAQFQKADLADPKQLPQSNLGVYAEQMRNAALDQLKKGKYLKAAKRGFNFCMSTGNLECMQALRPVFATDEAEVNQQTAVVAAIGDALQPTTPTRILHADDAQQMTRSAAAIIEARLAYTGDPAHQIGSGLRALADVMHGDDKGILQADLAQHGQAVQLVDSTEKLLNEGLRDRVAPEIERFVR